jgi:hypothetical protein
MSELDRYLERFGEQVHNAQPPRSRRGLALGALVAIAGAVIVATLLIGPGGSGRPVDAVAAARQALDPAGVILHMRVRVDAGPEVRGIQQSFQETWTAQDPQRWRLEQWNLGEKGEEVHRSEFAYAEGEQSQFEGSTLTIRQGYRDNTPQTRLPTLFSQTGDDPDADLRSLLTSGKLADAGEQQVGGRTVRRLVRDDGLRRFVIDVDPETFAPVGGKMTFRRPAGTRIPTMTQTFTVEAFERLPITPENETLLRISAPAGTRTVVHTAADMRRFEREYRRWRKRCTREKGGVSRCPGPPPSLDER